MNTSLNPERLRDIVDGFAALRIGVIGDVMLDIFTRGSAERTSPEAPVPIVLMESELEMPGGAGNVARGVASLGAHIDLVGVRGDDRAGHALSGLLKDASIQDCLVTDAGRRTTVKHRIIARDQHLLRVDWETTDPIHEESSRMLLEKISMLLTHWDALIIADYAKGVITEPFARELLQLAKKNKVMVTVDTKPAHFNFFKNVRLMSPNHHEAAAIAGTDDIQRAGAQLVHESGSSVLITQGAEGMTLFDGEQALHEPARAQSAVDVSGAGDTVSVAITLALAAGATSEEALAIASAAAAIAVSQPGTSAVTAQELLASLS